MDPVEPAAMQPPPPQVTTLRAADVSALAATAETVVHQAYPVKKPQEEHDEFMLQVRASTLSRARHKTAELARGGFPWAEVLLSVSSLAWGGLLGAIPAALKWEDVLGKIFYLALPIVGTGTLVAYILLRWNSVVDVRRVANAILDDLPDPDRAK